MAKLANKVAIVTGAASGIGRAIARLFAREGANVVLCDIDDLAGPRTLAEIHEEGGEATFIRCDVSRTEDCETVVLRTRETYGSIDILVNNAGIIRRATVLETTEREWDLAMSTNVKSVFLMCKNVIPHMLGAGGGAIVNMGSALSLAGGRQAVSYCAAKGAILNMTKAMALDHGAQNIRVNCLCPGDTDTGMLQEEARQLGCTTKEFMAASTARRPLGRLAAPLEIAKAALYLVSADSAYVTDTALVIDGGAGAGSGTSPDQNRLGGPNLPRA